MVGGVDGAVVRALAHDVRRNGGRGRRGRLLPLRRAQTRRRCCNADPLPRRARVRDHEPLPLQQRPPAGRALRARRRLQRPAARDRGGAADDRAAVRAGAGRGVPPAGPQSGHEPGRGSGRGRGRPSASARGAALGGRRQLHADRGRDEGFAGDAGADVRAAAAAFPRAGRRSVTAGWAIVGPGLFAGNRIAPALNKAVNGRLVAIVSRDRQRAEQFAEEHGAPRAYDDLDAALRDREIDCVWVATPHSLHLEPVLACAAARKHVLCEKPLATDRAGAREMIRACARANVRLGTGFHLRHHPLHKEARRLVEAGEFGDLVLDAAAEWSVAPPKPGEGYSSPWRRDPGLAFAGITTGTGVHAIDLLRYVLDDEIVAISAFTDAETSPIAPL